MRMKKFVWTLLALDSYDYATSGIDYTKGTSHHVEGSHYVKCTDDEFAQWCK